MKRAFLLLVALAAHSQAQDLQLKALEESLSIKRMEARLETLAKYADSLAIKKEAAAAAGDTAGANELAQKIKVIETELQQGLLGLEATSRAAQENLDALFESFQSGAGDEEPTEPEEMTAEPGPGSDAAKPADQKRQVPVVRNILGLGMSLVFQPRHAEWSRANTPLAAQDRNLRAGTKLTWTFTSAPPAGSYSVHASIRTASKVSPGKAELKVDGGKSMELQWPERKRGRVIPLAGRIELVEGCKTMTLASSEFSENLLSSYAILQILLVPVDKNTKLTPEPPQAETK
jgi:hypothetical protein